MDDSRIQALHIDALKSGREIPTQEGLDVINEVLQEWLKKDPLGVFDEFKKKDGTYDICEDLFKKITYVREIYDAIEKNAETK